MRYNNLLRCVLAATLLVFAAPAGAATITFELDFEYSGGDEPAGTPPWLVANFEDIGPNQVMLTFDTFGLVANEFVTSLFFNLDPALNAEFLSFSFYGGTGLAATVSLGNDAQNAGGDAGKGFDIQFNWSTAQGNRFIADKYIFYMITYFDPSNPDEAISADSFNFFNQGGFLSAAEIQGIGPYDGGGWIAAVPIPASAWLFTSGILGLAAIRKLFNKYGV